MKGKAPSIAMWQVRKLSKESLHQGFQLGLIISCMALNQGSSFGEKRLCKFFDDVHEQMEEVKKDNGYVGKCKQILEDKYHIKFADK